MRNRIIFIAVALAVVTACDRQEPTGPREEQLPGAGNPPAQGLGRAAERAVMDRLARRVARALDDPDFRTYLKEQLDNSRFVESKLQFQSFLRASEGRTLRQMTRLTGEAVAAIEADVNAAIPLEIYFPVPAHRAAWAAGPDVLVATAREDREAPVAYDVKGRKRLLSAEEPPATPVLAIVPVETAFDQDTPDPFICCAGGPVPPPPTPAPGLYMTYSHFVQDFEGWLKGSPEYEIHILGQAGASDSLTDYQCVGAQAGGAYTFDQNSLDWSGRVLLFSQTQLNNYRAAHPNQNFRIIALEDDDTACVLKFDSARFKSMLATLQTNYPNLTGGKDTTSSTLAKFVKRANALQKILRAAYSFITTQDDIIGNAIEDVVVGQSYTGANWIIKGPSNVTNGWIKLEMR